MTCELCQQNSPIFELKCSGCRDRMVMVEDCKLIRKWTAQQIEKDLGFLPDYKREPNCGCTEFCIRKSRIKNEQQTDIFPEKAPRRR